MLRQLSPRAPDKIIAIMEMFRADPRPDKIDLGVGVYRTEDGQTPIFRAVKAAEARLIEAQHTKAYVGLTGDAGFGEAIRDLVLGPVAAPERLAISGTVGGTNAVRQAFELVKLARPQAVVWLSTPTWPNHSAILDTVGLQYRTYRYMDRATGALDRDGMFADLGQVQPGDVVLLHGCCHNPTGVDPRADDWADLSRLILAKGAVPMIDTAYQGFGLGLDQDAAGIRLLARAHPELILTVSASKNFGLYRERVGAIIVQGETAQDAQHAMAALASLNRENFAFPPDHGARLVQMILGDADLSADWQAELEDMRLRVAANRRALAAALQERTGSDRFGFLADGFGMFSLLPANEEQVAFMRETHGLYMISDGRINLAGLTAETTAQAADIIATTLT